jgi:hypothetical protein
MLYRKKTVDVFDAKCRISKGFVVKIRLRHLFQPLNSYNKQIKSQAEYVCKILKFLKACTKYNRVYKKYGLSVVETFASTWNYCKLIFLEQNLLLD